MQGTRRIWIVLGGILLLALSWLSAAGTKSDTQRQAELIAQAEAYLADEIYIRAVPLLEEAAGCRGKHTLEAEEALKGVYLQLLEQSGYRRKYEALLETQMARSDAAEAPFREAAEYYLDLGSYPEALQALRAGIEKTGSAALTALYEENRYAYRATRGAYDTVHAIYNGAAQVELDGKWGLARADGSLVIPCEYDRVSTYSGGTILARKDGKITAIDADGNRTALLHAQASDFGNFADNRAGLQMEDGWHWCNGELETASSVFEGLGMFSEGYAAAKQDGRWGVIAKDGEWLVPPEYDEVVMDELGRCCGQGAVFVRQGGTVSLLAGGEFRGDGYEDARPFADGFAAVKKDGKWGFIDTEGAVRIDFRFDDALSFGQHVAAVREGSQWGYIRPDGTFAIEPCFEEAKSFSGGCAPARDYDGWVFLQLIEFEEETGL